MPSLLFRTKEVCFVCFQGGYCLSDQRGMGSRNCKTNKHQIMCNGESGRKTEQVCVQKQVNAWTYTCKLCTIQAAFLPWICSIVFLVPFKFLPGSVDPAKKHFDPQGWDWSPGNLRCCVLSSSFPVDGELREIKIAQPNYPLLSTKHAFAIP